MRKHAVLRGVVSAVFVLALMHSYIANAAEPVKPIVAKIAEYSNASHGNSIATARWAAKVEKRTNGKFKGEIYLGEALGKATTYTELVVNGGANVARVIGIYFPGKYPMIGASTLPLSWASAEAATKAFYKVWPKGYFDKEHSIFKVVAIAMHSPYQIISTKPIFTMADAKGKKLRTGGGAWTDIIASWGAIPVQITTPEVYSSLEKGLLDGAVIGLPSADAFKYQEVAKYVTLLNMGTSSSVLAMNLGFYNNLPKDVQAAINEVFDEESAAGLGGKDFDDIEKNLRTRWEAKGVKFHTPSEIERKAWFDATRSTIDKWVTETEKRGLPASKLLQDLEQLTKTMR